jgi:DNA-binding LytR/AlgR family response regulator
MPRILIADDEAAMREQLADALNAAWPEADIVAQAVHGADAWDQWLEHQPDACFLDIRMPGLTGLEVAQKIEGRCPVVFVTAYGDHALQAFEAGAVDYLVKPVEPQRLAQTVERLKQRLARHTSEPAQAEALQVLLSRLVPARPPQPETLQASIGKEIRIIRVADVVYFESDARYTRVVYREDGEQREALLRTPLKDLLVQLNPVQFQQVHRSVIVASNQIASAVRDDAGGMVLKLRGCPDQITVSRPFQGLFKGQ